MNISLWLCGKGHGKWILPHTWKTLDFLTADIAHTLFPVLCSHNASATNAKFLKKFHLKDQDMTEINFVHLGTGVMFFQKVPADCTCV